MPEPITSPTPGTTTSGQAVSAPAIVEPGTTVPGTGQAPPVEPTGQAGTGADFALEGVDPSTLDPKLQAIYKSMQAGFTKKMQALSEREKQASDFDALVQRPDFIEWAKAKVAAQQPAPQAGTPAPGSDGTPPPIDWEALDPTTRAIVQPLHEKVSMLNQYAALLAQERDRDQEQTVRAKYADYDTFRAQVRALRQQVPSLNYDEAYRIVAFDAARDAASKQALESYQRTLQEKQRASIPPTPGTAPSNVIPAKVKDFKEAAERAAKELGIELGPVHFTGGIRGH